MRKNPKGVIYMNFARKMNNCVANHMIRIWPVPLVFCHHNYLIDPLPSFNAVCVCDFIHSICLWQTRLFVPEKSRQNSTMRRHRRQTAGHQTCATNGFKKHAEKTQTRVQGVRWKPLRSRRQRENYSRVFDRGTEDRRASS